MAILSKEYDYQDDLLGMVSRYFEDQNATHLNPIAFEALAILYKTGALSVKIAKQQPFLFSYKDDPIIFRNQITIEAEARVHPMLWRALGITPNL